MLSLTTERVIIAVALRSFWKSDDGPVVPKLTREILVVLLNPSVDTVVPNLSADFPLVPDPVTVVPASPDDGPTVSEPTIDGPVVPDPPDLMFPVASTDNTVVDDLISPFPVGLDPLADGPVVPKPQWVAPGMRLSCLARRQVCVPSTAGSRQSRPVPHPPVWQRPRDGAQVAAAGGAGSPVDSPTCEHPGAHPGGSGQ